MAAVRLPSAGKAPSCAIGNVVADDHGRLLAIGARTAPVTQPLVLQSTDAGQTWSDVGAEGPSHGQVAFADSVAVAGALVAVCIMEDPTAAGHSDDAVCRSVDGGKTWARVRALPPAAQGENPFAVLLAGGGPYVVLWRQDSGTTIASSDAGQTWSTVANTPAPALSAWVSPAGALWMGGTLNGRPLLLQGHL
jgi:photosystem II stability/assembly factor-like uncharacterized protein